MVEGQWLGKRHSGFVRVDRGQVDAWHYPQTARFWAWEGYYHERTRWELVGCEVIREYAGDESDCDGPHRFEREQHCNVLDLGAVRMDDPEAWGRIEPENIGIARPEWEDISRSERHAIEEAAGY